LNLVCSFPFSPVAQQIVNELERLLELVPPSQTATTLPPSHDISLLIRQILVIAGHAADREETALAFSQKAVQLLYKAPTQLGREVYAALLDRLCDASPQVSREATEWLLYAEDEASLGSMTKFPPTITEVRVTAQVQRSCDISAPAKCDYTISRARHAAWEADIARYEA
jgi:hypothetical protein